MKNIYQRKKRSQRSRTIEHQTIKTISTREKISPQKCQELWRRSVERLSCQILKRMLSWKILKKERKWNVNLAFTICQQISKTLTSLLVLSRSVWTILWEMMSRLKEKYMCVLLYACILQKLVGHRAMQIAIIDKYLVSEFRKFYWTWVWQRFVQSFCNFCIKHIGHSSHFWPIVAKICFLFFLRENFFVSGKILKPARIDQGHIWTKNSRWLTPTTSNS